MVNRPPRDPLHFRPIPGVPARPPRLGLEIQPPAARVAEFLKAAREEIAHIRNLEDLTGILGAIRELEAEVETARLLVILGVADEREVMDEIVDSAGAAKLLARTRDWTVHNKGRLTGALVSPVGTRPRYSKNKLIELRERWNRSARTHS
jgi:hypothetical protein